MLGEEMLDEMIEAVREYADYESLLEIISENEKKNLSWTLLFVIPLQHT